MDTSTVSTFTELLAQNPMAAITAIIIVAAATAAGAAWGFLKVRVDRSDSRDTDRDKNIISLTQVGFETLGKVTEVVRNCEVSIIRQSDSNNAMVQSNNAISTGLQQVVVILKELVEGQKDTSDQMRMIDRRIGRLEVPATSRTARQRGSN